MSRSVIIYVINIFCSMCPIPIVIQVVFQSVLHSVNIQVFWSELKMNYYSDDLMKELNFLRICKTAHCS